MSRFNYNTGLPLTNPSGNPPFNDIPHYPPNAPGQPGQYPFAPHMLAGHPGQNAPNPYGLYPNLAPTVHAVPSAMSYPQGIPNAPIAPTAVMPNYAGYPTAPAQPGYPSVTPQPNYGQPVEWIPTTSRDAAMLSDRAVVAGYEGHDGSPLWVIRARFQGDLIPGKLAVKHRAAYVPWGGNENSVQDIEVCCARPERVRWVDSRDGIIPANAIVGGNTSSGEPLYIGRAKEQGSLTPGKVHPSHNSMYISFAGKEVAHKVYEILCTV